MLNIENKFNIGDEVYVIQKVKIKNPCSACNGAGHKIIDGNKFYCSKCNGKHCYCEKHILNHEHKL